MEWAYLNGSIIPLEDARVPVDDRGNNFGDEVRTHPATQQILPGITRGRVLELAREMQMPVREEAVPVAQVASVTEIFLTGTGCSPQWSNIT